MLKKDRRGFYVVNSFEKLAEVYKASSESQQDKNKKMEQKIRAKEAKKQKKQDS